MMILDLIGVIALGVLSVARFMMIIRGHWWGLPIFLHTMIAIFLLIVHHQPKKIPPFLQRLTAWESLLLPLMILIDVEIPVANRIISLIGVGLSIWALLSLGKSFDVSPADRGLVKRGPYRLVRHPMYLGELISIFSLVILDLSVRNILLTLALLISMIARINWEEKIIGGYSDYSNEVRGRLIPGVW
jgi:isoprenylcysteine carboxyl methyltransferase (ICMT) family protein YpbQ